MREPPERAEPPDRDMALDGERPAYRIETARLVLRCWAPTDAPELKAAVDGSLEQLRRWLPWAERHPRTIEEIAGDLRRMRRSFDGDEDYCHGVFDAAEREVLGGCGLHLRAGTDALEIGYWIREDRWGEGLATELSAALVRVAFQVEEVQRLDLRCEPDNAASIRVAEKLGFRHEGTLRRVLRPAGGRLRDGMVWVMIPEEYGSSPAAKLAHDVRAFSALGRRLF